MNIEYNEKNCSEVYDYHSSLLKVDIFRSEDFKAAVNINRGLYKVLDNKEEITNMKYEKFKKLTK